MFDLSKMGAEPKLWRMQDPASIGDSRPDPEPAQVERPVAESPPPPETGGRAGPDPTRYGDWEKNGRCIDF